MSVSAISGAGSSLSTSYTAGATAGGGTTSVSHSASLTTGQDGATFSSQSVAMSQATGSMAEQVMQLLAAALALKALGGDEEDKDKDKSALGLALALAVMGQQQHSTFSSQSVSYTSGGQAVQPGQTGSLVNAMA